MTIIVCALLVPEYAGLIVYWDDLDLDLDAARTI
jgi:hypothetical protein